MKRSLNTLPALIAVALAAVLLAGGAMAHGEKKHLMGKVLLIKADSLVVESKDGKTIEVKISSSTIFLKDEKPARLADLAIGDRVVIHTASKGLDLLAEEVHFSAPPAPKPPKD
ncbi:MAG: hypothetical protein LAN71_15370 [Acidobacteriia bacterium]|nr:hypothetical protein [Terriglobia bacterium]